VVGLGNRLSASTILKQLSGVVSTQMPFARPRRNSRYGALNTEGGGDDQKHEGGIALASVREGDIETGGGVGDDIVRNISDLPDDVGLVLSAKLGPLDLAIAAASAATDQAAITHLQAGYIPTMPGRARRQSSIDTTYEDEDERYSDYDMQQYFVDRDVVKAGDGDGPRQRYNSDGEVETERDRRGSENESYIYEEQTAEERDRKDSICHGTINKTATYDYVT
jgi:hypothetical protein